MFLKYLKITFIMDKWDKYYKYENLKYYFAPFMGAGFGLIIAYFIDNKFVLFLGLLLIFLSACGFAVMVYLMNREVKKKNKGYE